MSQITKGVYAYYNEINKFACAWLRELIAAGCITPGDVDERPIEEVQIEDLYGYDRCHFFAGIGGWDYALNLANWGSKECWTGSCPCQPFSSAGKQKGFDDARHLWPVWANLIALGRPATIFGEQVASPAGLNWFDLVSADLEDQDYAVAAADLCAASVGSPHIRQRLYWVADADHARSQGWDRAELSERAGECVVGTRSASCCRMAEPHSLREHAPIHGSGQRRQSDHRAEADRGGARDSSAWASCEWIPCVDGKSRPVEPGTSPLAYGIPARVGQLRGYGNAIVPQVAQAFIESFLAIS